MDEQLKLLKELQKIDLAQEELRLDVEKRKDEVDGFMEQLQELEQIRESEAEKLSEQKKLLETKFAERDKAQEGQDHANVKLNAVTNSRDYAALEREIENFKKISSQVESEIEGLQKAVSEAEAENAKKTAECDELKAMIDKCSEDVRKAAEAIEGRVAELQAQSKELSRGIKPQILARYRFIRSKRHGEAVVSASGGTCTGCHMKLQPQAYIVLQRQNSLECCQNCQRIIYFDKEEAEALRPSKEK